MQNFWNVAASGVHGPLYEVHAPPTGNPGSATAIVKIVKIIICSEKSPEKLKINIFPLDQKKPLFLTCHLYTFPNKRSIIKGIFKWLVITFCSENL